MPIPVAVRSKAKVCGRSPPEIVGSNPTGGMDVCFECCVLSGIGLCDEPNTRTEESCRLWCVAVCDLETSWMRRPWPTGGFAPKTNIYVYLKITGHSILVVWSPIKNDVILKLNSIYSIGWNVLKRPIFLHRSQDSEVGIATRLLAGRSGFRISVGVTDFSSLKRPHRHLNPIYFIQWLWGVLSRRCSGRSMKLTTHFQLVQCLRMSEFPPLPSWYGLGKLHLYFQQFSVYIAYRHVSLNVGWLVMI